MATWSFTVLLTALVIWLLPVLIVASSSRVTGKEKLAWILAILFISWIAFIIYLLIAPIKQEQTT